MQHRIPALILILAAATGPALAETSTERGIRLGYSMKYGEAEKAFNEVIKQAPKHPKGHFLKTGIYFWQFALDNSNQVAAEKLRESAETAIDLAEDILDEKPDDDDALFYLGGAYGGLARYHLINQNWLRTLYYGNKGYATLKELNKKNPKYWDAYLGVGMFDFYASVLPSIITAFLETPGDRDKGLEYISIAAERGSILKAEARFFKGQMQLIFERDYVAARKTLEAFVRSYPGNVSAEHMLGMSYAGVGEVEPALKIYEKALAGARSHGFNEEQARINQNIARAHHMNNDFAASAKSHDNVMKATAKNKDRRFGMYAVSWLGMCNNLALKGDLAKARTCFRGLSETSLFTADTAGEWLEAPFGAADVEIARANNLLETRQFKSALAAFREIESRVDRKVPGYPASKKPRVWAGIGRSLLEENKADQSVNYFERILAVEEPESSDMKPWAWYYHGRARRQQGRFKDASRSLENALESENPRIEIFVKKEQHLLSKSGKKKTAH